MLHQTLRAIGFSDKESNIYLALITLGDATAAQLAKHTQYIRATVYDILESLIHRGVVSKYKKGAKTHFQALDPRELIHYLEREAREKERSFQKQKKLMENVLPEFLSLQNFHTTRPKVQFYEGEKGLREAYEDSLTCKGKMLAYTNVQTMLETLPNFFPEYFQRRAKKKIPIRAIFVQNEVSRARAKLDRQELRETKFLPDPTLTFSPEVKIYNDKMLIASWKEKMAVIIESKEFADLQKIIFQLLWDRLGK